MVRTMMGLVAGTILAGLALYAGHHAYTQLHPLPPGLDRNDVDAYAEFAIAAPGRVIACILAAWALAGLLGGWIAALVAGPHRRGAGLAVGALLTAGTIVYATWMPNQAWVPILAMLLPIPFALSGSLLATPRTEI